MQFFEKITVIIFELVLSVEKRMQDEMQDCRGAFLYDSRACNNMHFTAIIASYCTTTNAQIRNNHLVDSVPKRTLLDLSPMGTTDGDTSESNNEGTTFNAKIYINFIKKTFDVLECSFEKWYVVLIGIISARITECLLSQRNRIWLFFAKIEPGSET